jgi:hypothetical protein
MDTGTKKLVLRYVNCNYALDYADFINYQVMNLENCKKVSIGRVYEDIMDIFGLTAKETGEYFSFWVDSEAIRIDNERADNMYNMYTDGIPLSMEERVQVWGSMGNIAKLKAIHETHSKHFKGDF